MNYIYRDYSCILSQKSCSQLLQALALTRGAIVCSYPMSNGFPDNKVNRWEMHFRLRFGNETSVNKFHELAGQTEEPDQVVMEQ